jgi:hypothetical protein
MTCKLTCTICLITIFTVLQCICGFFVLKEETTKSIITACQYIWAYNLSAIIGFVIQTFYNAYAIVFTILTTDGMKKRRIMLYLTGLALLIIIGSIIKVRISSGCIDSYENNYPKTWLYFNVTYWYSVSAWCMFAVVNLLYCIYYCCHQSNKTNIDRKKMLDTLREALKSDPKLRDEVRSSFSNIV